MAITPRASWARTALDVSYPAGEVWGTAVRFLRVDNGYPVREKDRDSGYILFDYLDGSGGPGTMKKSKGALEVLTRRDREGRSATQIVASIPDLPKHVEALLLDKLGRKLREELGAPAPPPPRGKERDKAPGREAGRDDGNERDKPAAKPDPDNGDGLPRIPQGDLPRVPAQDKPPAR